MGKAATRTPHGEIGAILNTKCRITPAGWVHLSGFNLEVEGKLVGKMRRGNPEVTAASLELSMCVCETVDLQHTAAKFRQEAI